MNDQNRDKIKYVGLALRRRREELGISQETFAFENKIGRKHISSIENGKQNMTLESLFRLTNGLKIEPSEILKIAEELEAEERKDKSTNSSVRLNEMEYED